MGTQTGSYGEGVEVLRIEGLLDDPETRKEVDALPEGPEKEAARAALPNFEECECAGDAKKDFSRVIDAIDATKESGGATMVHCYASISRSVAFILAYIMKDERITLVEAVERMGSRWEATWPNDHFVEQLLEYELEAGLRAHPVPRTLMRYERGLIVYGDRMMRSSLGGFARGGKSEFPSRFFGLVA